MTTIDFQSGEPVGPVVEVPWPGAIALNRAGDRLGIAASSGGGEARLVDVATGTILGTPLAGNRLGVAFSGDGALMAAIGQSADVRVFNSTDGSPAVPDLKLDFGGSSGFFFSADESHLFVVSPGGDIAKLDLVGDTKLGRPVDWAGDWPMSFSVDGRLAAVASAVDNSVALIDVGSGQVLRVLRPAARGAPPFDRPGLAGFSPDGARVAVGSAASDDQPAEIEIFSTVDGRSELRLPVPGVPYIVGAEWSPDGRVIAGAYQAQVIRVDATSGERLDDLELPGLSSVDQIDYAPDGRLFVAGDIGLSFVFDSSGRPIKTDALSDHQYFTGSWGPDGTLVLPDYSTGEVRIVDPVTNRQTFAVYAGPTGFTQVAVGSNGRGGLRGVAASTGNLITLWDVATGQTIGDPIEAGSAGADALTNVNTALAADPDHHQMILWDLDPAVWQVRACEAAGRNLTRDEWKNYLPDGEPYHATCPQYKADV